MLQKIKRALFNRVFGATIIGLMIFSISFSYFGKSAELVVDGKSQKVFSFASNVSGLLRERGIILSDGDWINPEGRTPLSDGLVIAVDRLKTVTFLVGEEKRIVSTTTNSVGEFLKSKSETHGNFDLTYNDLDEEIKTGMVIRVVRLYRVPEVETPRKLAYLPDRGIKRTPALSSDVPSGLKIVSTITLTATAYTPGYDCGYITATGAKAGFGIVAVDPKVIPLGTKVYVEGYGEAIALDTGGAIKGNRIDLCYETYDEAIQFGRRKVTVHILAD